MVSEVIREMYRNSYEKEIPRKAQFIHKDMITMVECLDKEIENLEDRIAIKTELNKRCDNLESRLKTLNLLKIKVICIKDNMGEKENDGN